ncbi:major facilitator superfamily domain-containing protein [Penicillium chermesinum]|uniref:Major facilitator superfamily domain-containing protein n=1 Tax=Penicillium chermesinum TaxID=63820 RepID=A0A9W9PLM5_9EURO|nr:major facilitator superfamily domain-containing protein [Penicillium chermesinum]KAJ5249014.1 major facilitator superfamily domain-containing protein [Penicillium chermesinum]
MAESEEHDPRSSASSADIESHSESDNMTHEQNGESPPLEKQSTSASGISAFQQRTQSVVSRIRSREPGQTAKFTHPLSHTKTSTDVLVDFDGPDDPYRPLNWGFKKKAITTVLYGLTTMGATWASSIYSTGTNQISHEFGVSTEVGTLGTALLLFGLGLGPLVWAPLSEVYGRKPAVLAPYFIAAIMSFGTATAKDLQTIMLTRFFCGFFGSAPVTNTGGVLSDIWTAEQRGAAIVGYAMAVVGGPVLGPIVGGAVVQSYLRWRWTEYLTGIMMMFFLTLDLLFIDESYPPVLLVYKARRLRFETGNWALHARHEEWDVTLKELGNKYLIRPFQLLATPICFLVALYASFVYGILYLSLAAFPIVFQQVRGWNQLVGALPFLAYLVGILFGAALNLFNQRFYVKRYRANNNRPVPEARLPPMMVGSIMFAAGLFVFGWTSPKHIHWIGPIIGAVMMGFGFFTIFQAALNYLVDTFQQFSASAVAANTFLRSMCAGGFPLFTSAMFHNLGVPWAASLLGFISVALIPIPYLFYIFGRRIRARGKWSRASL